MELPKLLLTREEIAQCLGISERTVTDWINEADLPMVRIKGSVRFSPKAVQEWIDRMQGQQASNTASVNSGSISHHQVS